MIEARAPLPDAMPVDCAGCHGTKKAPIAMVLSIRGPQLLRVPVKQPGQPIWMAYLTDDELANLEISAGMKKMPADPSLVMRALAEISEYRKTPTSHGSELVLCEECGRDLANAVGFMCVRDGGWSKLEPRKQKAPR